MTCSGLVDTGRLWALIEDARCQVPEVRDSRNVAARATALLSAYPPGEIIAAGPVLWQLLVDSYRSPLWAAAYIINGGCSDDGFDYFRGWLLMQGREVFERVLSHPDTLADLPVTWAERFSMAPLECEEALYIASLAYRQATGEDYPKLVFTTRYPDLDPEWDFDFDDSAEMARRLPRLAARCFG